MKKGRDFVPGPSVEAAIASGTGALTAATKGVPLVVVAAISEEDDGSIPRPIVLEKSPSSRPRISKARPSVSTACAKSFELGARLALLDAGLDPDRDMNWAVVPPPTMGEALRGGKIDLASLSQPFFAAEKARGGVRILFTAHSAMKFKEEFVLYFNPDFVKKNRAGDAGLRCRLSRRYQVLHAEHARRARSDLGRQAGRHGPGRLSSDGRAQAQG